MPVYEFYCNKCNTIYNFFSKRVNTTKTPICPGCNTNTLSRKMSIFSVTGKEKQDTDDTLDFPFDENKMNKAMDYLSKNAENIDEDDPRQAANLMKNLTNITGMEMGEGMQEAIKRMESGENPEQIENDIGDLIEAEEPFIIPEKKGKKAIKFQKKPDIDERLYDL